MEAQNSITVGRLTFAWNGQGLTLTSPSGQEELDANESYDLLCWLHDDQAQNLYRAAHPGRPGNTYEEGKE